MRVSSIANRKLSLRFPWLLPVLFAAGVLLLGMADGWITLGLFHGNPAKNPIYRTPPIWPADWFFGLVWNIIYPCLGVATALIWQQRHAKDIRGAIACFGGVLVVTLLFLPLSVVVKGNPIGLTLMDLGGLLISLLLAWTYRKITLVALWWLLPLLLWMPVTLLIKIWFLSLNIPLIFS